MFKAIVKDAQHGNQEAMLQVIQKFDPIISKYAYMLNYEDSKSDIILFLLELIGKISLDRFLDEGQLVVYILKSLKNEFIRLSRSKAKKNHNEFLIDDLFDNQEPISKEDPMENVNSKLFLTNLMKQHLTEKEKIILYKFFVEDKPMHQIASEEHISRQAANQTKNTALKKMRTSIDNISLHRLN